MRVVIGVIAYNEEKNLPFVIEELRRDAPEYDIVVIDNGSKDGTRALCKRLGVPCISHAINTGSSFGTVLTYLIYAFEKDYDIVCQFDGDCQHVASDLPKIIAPIESNQADYVIGSRFIKKEGFQSSLLRRIVITFFATIVSRLVGVRITDVTSGFKAYGKRSIEFFARDYRCEIYDTMQMILLVNGQGLKIREVPVTMRERLHGSSEFTPYRSVTFTIKAMANIIGYIIQRKKI